MSRDLDAAEELLDPDVETVTPRGAVHGIAPYERDFALRLTLVDGRIVRVVVMPGEAPPPGRKLTSG